jgi:hypothetical protein
MSQRAAGAQVQGGAAITTVSPEVNPQSSGGERVDLPMRVVAWEVPRLDASPAVFDGSHRR